MGKPDLVVVWGNCQSGPIAELLRAPMAAAGLEVVDVAPVYLADEGEIGRVHRLVREAALLVSQPVPEEYRFAGSGTAALKAELPSAGRLVRFPSTFHVGPFPYLVNAHGGDGVRVDAPITDYHDLRVVLAAADGFGVDEAMTDWPVPTADAVRMCDAESLERLRRRETGLDVQVSDLVGAPDALWSMNHPSNAVLASIAERVLSAVGIDGAVDRPVREFLAERKAPVDAVVADALGWPAASARPLWVVRDEAVPQADVLAAHLDFYAGRPDVVADTMQRYAQRLVTLKAQPSASARRSAPVSPA